jgi:hypothetical protein
MLRGRDIRTKFYEMKVPQTVGLSFLLTVLFLSSFKTWLQDAEQSQTQIDFFHVTSDLT